jgi:hypothetical protein
VSIDRAAAPLIKSRERVKAHGEVFTPRHMVDQMLDLVQVELESGPDFVDKTFLEPAAGDGNFLLAILERKLAAVAKHFPASSWPYESLFALASIYGIEFLEDNHVSAKNSMLEEFEHFHASRDTPYVPRPLLAKAAEFIIDSNIVQGNTLTGLDSCGKDIQLSWWNRVPGVNGMVQRESFSLRSLRGGNTFDFNVYEPYAECRIDRVHEEVRASE